jgi:hypothetical protein
VSFGSIQKWRLQVVIVIPVLAVEALNHVATRVAVQIGLSTVAILLKEILVIDVQFILKICLFAEELAGVRHSSVAAVAPEVEFLAKLEHFVALMAGHTATETEAVGLGRLSSDLSVACLAGEDFLQYVAFAVAALLSQLYTILILKLFLLLAFS